MLGLKSPGKINIIKIIACLLHVVLLHYVCILYCVHFLCQPSSDAGREQIDSIKKNPIVYMSAHHDQS